ncbi:MAG: glutaredoxin 3 [Parvibaculales bacterium]
MKKITIFTTQTCPYCHAAKDLLSQKNAAFEEIDVTGNPDLRSQMSRRADGRTSVPQIFFGEEHIGGCDDLYELENQGRLDNLLSD